MLLADQAGEKFKNNAANPIRNAATVSTRKNRIIRVLRDMRLGLAKATSSIVVISFSRGAVSTRLKSRGSRFGASRMIGIVRALSAATEVAWCGFVLPCASGKMETARTGESMPTPDKQLSAEQSRQIAET